MGATKLQERLEQVQSAYRDMAQSENETVKNWGLQGLNSLEAYARTVKILTRGLDALPQGFRKKVADEFEPHFDIQLKFFEFHAGLLWNSL